MADVKPYKSIDEQIEILEGKSLLIRCKDSATKALSQIGYYRLSGYALCLRTEDKFHENTTLDQILAIHNFDTELKIQILKVLSYIEIAFRAQIANVHTEEFGPTGYLEYKGFSDYLRYNSFLYEVYKVVDSSKYDYMATKIHHMKKYEGRFPFWVMIQFFTFTLLSKTFSNLEPKLKKKISLIYGYKYSFIENWLLILSELRNVCAHCGRLHNGSLPSIPSLPYEDSGKLIMEKSCSGEIRHDRLLFSYLYILRKMILDDDVWLDFLIYLDGLIKRNDAVKIEYYGFPKNWIDLLCG